MKSLYRAIYRSFFLIEGFLVPAERRKNNAERRRKPDFTRVANSNTALCRFMIIEANSVVSVNIVLSAHISAISPHFSGKQTKQTGMGSMNMIQ